jgi:hypothetical protein
LRHGWQKKTKIGKAESKNYKESRPVMVIWCPSEGVKTEGVRHAVSVLKYFDEKLVLKK